MNSEIVQVGLFGGEGGERFELGRDQTAIANLMVKSGSTVNSLSVTDNKGTCYSCGGEGEDEAELSLSDGEFFNDVIIRENGSEIMSVTLKTNEGNTIGPCGGDGSIFQRSRTDSELHGGDGGGPFDDGENKEGISTIAVRSGKLVDAIQVTYRNGERTNHGGDGGGRSELKLEDGEYINDIRLRVTKDEVMCIALKTNLGNVLGPCGDPDGSLFNRGKDHVIEVPDGTMLVGIKGRCGDRLDAIGFYWGPVYKEHTVSAPSGSKLVSITGRASDRLDAIGFRWGPIYEDSSVFGGTGGEPFKKGREHDGITCLGVSSGTFVNAISIKFANGEETLHGEEDGDKSLLELGDTEFINEIVVRASEDEVLCLMFKTNEGNTLGPCGGEGSVLRPDEQHVITAPTGSKLIGVKGQCSDRLNAIGFLWGKVE